ncbi:MAG: aldo/keto reductase [Candidatus Poribacteria bacterium]|nr:aldo/keto reductase [Candidatus Poribacteria bacterium]
MKYRVLGKTGWEVSAVGMGCWGIAGQWGAVEEKEAVTTMQRAVELGVNLFDTADAYGTDMGTSEELVGEALASHREHVYIATKVGNWAGRFGHALPYTHPLHIKGCCDASLYRLKTDYIDLYQCHISGLAEPDVFLEAFEALVQAGKVRAYGISTDSLDVLQRFNRDGNCAVCQLNYSILRRDAESELLPYCLENNIGTLIRGPLAQGVLTGKFTPASTFTDWVREDWNEGEGRERFLRNLETVEQLSFLARDDRNLAQAALQFVLAHPGVTCPIPGAKSIEQIEANAAAADGELSEDELQRINQVLEN